MTACMSERHDFIAYCKSRQYSKISDINMSKWRFQSKNCDLIFYISN